MYFGKSFLDDLAERVDIVELVGRYVKLTKKGARYSGLCPFHSEKNPSFSVSPERQSCYCFSCNKGGDVISFVREMENLDFKDAVAFLCKEYHIPLPEDDGQQQSGLAARRQKIVEANTEAARWFRSQLYEPHGKEAVAYLQTRQLPQNIIDRFGLGYAPDSWDALTKALREKGFEDDILADAGLAGRNQQGGLYDFFRHKVIFPIIDSVGKVIAFGGRVLDDSKPKYVNTRETILFNKRNTLYGLNLAKRSKQGRMILAEGYMDVIALHMAGFDCAVATLGTALNEAQARMLGKYSKNVIIAYDYDTPGRNAAKRAIEILKPFEYAIKVVRIPDGKDPDDFIKKRGADAFEALLSGSEQDMEYRLFDLFEDYSMEDNSQRIAFLTEASLMLAGLRSAIEREVYAERVATLANVSKETVLLEVAKEQKKKQKQEQARAHREELRPAQPSKEKNRGIRYKNPACAIAEEGLINLLFSDPSLLSETGGLGEADFSVEHFGKIFALLKETVQQGEKLHMTLFGQILTPEEQANLAKILAKSPSVLHEKQAVADYLHTMRKEGLAKKSMDDEDALLEKIKLYKDRLGYGG